MMVDQTAHYQALAGALITVCKPGFTRAEIVATLESGYSKVVYNCAAGSDAVEGLPSSMETDLTVDEALHALRDGMQQEGRSPWSSCTFTLFPDGEFKFDVRYDD
jgi:hypothetical protein